MKIVVNLQSVVIDMPKAEAHNAMNEGDFSKINPLVLKAVTKQLKAGDGIESLEEL